MTRAAPPSVFKPYAAERTLDLTSIQVAFCERCPPLGRRTELVFGTDAIGRTTTRCPACDGVAPRRPVNPNEVLRPQALIAASQLLPACPPGVLRCQGCARPVEGDARLCERCEMPALRRISRRPLPDVVVDPRAIRTATAEVLGFVVRALDVGARPSVQYIADQIASSPQTVEYHLKQLVRKGYLSCEGSRKSRVFAVLIREPVLRA